MSTPRLLVIQHEDSCPTGWVGDWLTEAGVELDVVRAWEGTAIPPDLTGHQGLLVLGGEMNAYADATHPWLGATRSLIAETVRSGAPFLGICLGHQLAAVALGGTVEQHAGGPRRGLTPTGLTDAVSDDTLMQCVTPGAPSVHFNGDVVTVLPEGSVVLAVTDDGAPQAVRFAHNAWGLQFHPEAGHAIFDRWAIKDAPDQFPADQGFNAFTASSAVREAEAELVSTWRPVLHRFASLLTP